MQPFTPCTAARAGGAFCGFDLGERHLRGSTVSYGLVCGVADDTNADRARDTDESDSVRAVARELAVDGKHVCDHGDWGVSPVLTAGVVPGFCAAAAAVLGAIAGDARL